MGYPLRWPNFSASDSVNKPLQHAKALVKDTMRLLGHEYVPYSLNEAVNFDKQTIFIAVPKTGTTSVRVQICPKGKPLIPNPHLNILQIRDSLYTYVLRASLAQNTRFPSEGVPTDAEVRERTKEVFDTFFKFSAARNPWARAVSLYYRREGVQVAEEMSFEEFCEQHRYANDTCRHPTLHQNQLDWMVDENGALALDYVYKVENYGDAIKEIADLTDGRLQLEYKEANTNPKSKSRNYQDLYTDKTRKLIAKHFEKDIDFFKYTF